MSPVLVNKIVEGHIDEQWVQCLKEVDKRTASLRSTSGSQPKSIKAAADLLPLLDKLVLKVSVLVLVFVLLLVL